MLLSGCETVASSVVVTPDLHEYGGAFLDQLADENDALAAPCDRLDPAPGCSALARAVVDYTELRERVRALRGGG